MTRVVLLREGAALESPSMRIYADRLAAGFSPALTVECPAWNGRPAASIGRYSFRYRQVPRALRVLRDREGAGERVYHILDHANAHWLRALSPERSVVTCHDLMLLKLSAGELRSGEGLPLLAAAAFRWSVSHLPRAAAVVCDSAATRDDAHRLLACDPGRLHVIPPGLDPAFRVLPNREAARAHTRRRHRVTARSLLLHVGHHFFYKNLEGLLRALARLARSGVNAQLLKVGAHLTPAQRALARRLGLAPRVIEPGAVDLAELVELYNAADAVVYPSFAEGFGWPLLEAMACGTPLVTSDRGVPREVTAGAACLVDPDEPAAIADGIGRVLTDDAYRGGLVARGLVRAREFTWSRTFEALGALYRRVGGDSIP